MTPRAHRACLHLGTRRSADERALQPGGAPFAQIKGAALV